MEEARYRYLRPVKGGLVWLRAPVTGVLGEGGADPDDDWPRPALQRFDLRKREVKELAGALRLVPGQRRRHPARGPRPR